MFFILIGLSRFLLCVLLMLDVVIFFLIKNVFSKLSESLVGLEFDVFEWFNILGLL